MEFRKSSAKSLRLGLVGILTPDVGVGRDQVAGLLSEYRRIIVGMVNLPCPEPNMTMTCVSVESTTNDLGAFTGKLGLAHGVRVKSMLW